MVRYKIIEMVDGKVTFTKKELEELLAEVYNEGYENGRNKVPQAWAPGLRELTNEPTCLDKSITYNGATPKMTYRDSSAGEEKW